MSKLIAFTAVAVSGALAICIASLVINIIILTKSNTINTNTNNIQKQLKTPPANNYNAPACTSMGVVSNSSAYGQAAAFLLSGIDTTVDPCEDFYAFTCNKYLSGINLQNLGLSRKGTYDDSQASINKLIAQTLSTIDIQSNAVSNTEKITKIALDACVADAASSNTALYTKDINKEILGYFGGIPFLNQALNTNDLFSVSGQIERNHAVGTLMASYTSVDYQNVKQNALYVSQPSLDMPHDYFVKPQYIDKLADEQSSIFQIMQGYANATGVQVSVDQLQQYAMDVVNFEVAIAMASWPDDLMRNYKQQYNAYNYKALNSAYGKINWMTYLTGLLSPTRSWTLIQNDQIVLMQPSYFAWLESVFAGKGLFSLNTIANYMIVQLLQDEMGYWGSAQMKELIKKKNYIPHVHRKGKGVRRIGRRYQRKFDDQPPEIGCVDDIMGFMPYGPGYVYVKNQTYRDAVAQDVKVQTLNIISNFQEMMHSLNWMSNYSYSMALKKSNSLVQNYGWPTTLFGDFKNFAKTDQYHTNYMDILNYGKNDYYKILKVLKQGFEIRETVMLLNSTDTITYWGTLRANFLSSPAEVNAWYQPERNSITFPYAAWNPPYYNFDYPQAYNYAGQGGTGGHELTHGFDDEGVQFDWDGSMTDCDKKYKCGWMDTASNDGFTDMAQCVVSQFSSQCCPLKSGNVHCANGATTQGENIADLGGQQAAYNAYRQYIDKTLKQEELRLPGMPQYTPNQIFWITYGYSWCMLQSDASMTKQLLTNPHAPAQCRVNQVMQDIPAFGKDFNCRQGVSAMYPADSQRCKVWVGY